jgi:hypothetical protein
LLCRVSKLQESDQILFAVVFWHLSDLVALLINDLLFPHKNLSSKRTFDSRPPVA